MKELLKSVNICQSYRKNKSGTFLWPTVYKPKYYKLITAATILPTQTSNGSFQAKNAPQMFLAWADPGFRIPRYDVPSHAVGKHPAHSFPSTHSSCSRSLLAKFLAPIQVLDYRGVHPGGEGDSPQPSIKILGREYIFAPPLKRRQKAAKCSFACKFLFTKSMVPGRAH